MPKKQTFKATIQNTGGGGAFVEVPFDVEKAFGSKKSQGQGDDRGSPISWIAHAHGRTESYADHPQGNP